MKRSLKSSAPSVGLAIRNGRNSSHPPSPVRPPSRGGPSALALVAGHCSRGRRARVRALPHLGSSLARPDSSGLCYGCLPSDDLVARRGCRRGERHHRGRAVILRLSVGSRRSARSPRRRGRACDGRAPHETSCRRAPEEIPLGRRENVRPSEGLSQNDLPRIIATIKERLGNA